MSARTLDELPYAGELAASGARIALSREASPAGSPPGSAPGRPAGRLSAADIQPLLAGWDPACFVCGSASFAEAATVLLTDAGVEARRIRFERFGPTGS